MDFTCFKHKKLNKRPYKAVKIMARFIYRNLKANKFTRDETLRTINEMLVLITKGIKKGEL